GNALVARRLERGEVDRLGELRGGHAAHVAGILLLVVERAAGAAPEVAVARESHAAALAVFHAELFYELRVAAAYRLQRVRRFERRPRLRRALPLCVVLEYDLGELGGKAARRRVGHHDGLFLAELAVAPRAQVEILVGDLAAQRL